MKNAPIALFVFNRPEETRRTLHYLAANEGIKDSELFIFCDAPRDSRDASAVKATRDVVRERLWCPNTTIICKDTNAGLARSIILGVTELCESHGRVIVLEDDLLLAKGGLRYFNEALNRYANESRIMQISAHILSIPNMGDTKCSFLLPLTTSWGWATWQRAWQSFDHQGSGWEALKTDYQLRRSFNLDGAYDFAEMLEAQKEGKLDSWAIYWRWTMFRAGAFALFPAQTLVRNIGFGETATHTKVEHEWLLSPDWTAQHEITQFPNEVAVDETRWQAVKNFYAKSNVMPFHRKIFRLLRAAMRNSAVRWIP